MFQWPKSNVKVTIFRFKLNWGWRSKSCWRRSNGKTAKQDVCHIWGEWICIWCCKRQNKHTLNYLNLMLCCAINMSNFSTQKGVVWKSSRWHEKISLLKLTLKPWQFCLVSQQNSTQGLNNKLKCWKEILNKRTWMNHSWSTPGAHISQ